MGVRFPGLGNTTIVTPAIAAAGETVLFTSSPLNLSLDFQQVMIFWFINWTVGTGTTSTAFRIRRGTTITATSVTANLTVTTAASSFASFSGCYIDSPGAVAGVQYSLTGNQTAGTGTASINDGCILVMAL